MNFGSGTSRPRPSLSMVLVLAIVLLGVLWIMRTQVPWRQSVPRGMGSMLGWGSLLANFAIAVIGLRTPQRNAWLIYFGVSVVTLVAFGSMPLVAAMFLPALLKSFLS